MEPKPKSIVIIGAGFTGLTAALELSRLGIEVTLIEADKHVGGLASSFQTSGDRLDKFYHHWFVSDTDVMQLIDEVGMSGSVAYNPSRTGLYYSNNYYQLSSPIDLLKFKALSLFDRLRLGMLAINASFVKDWHQLENFTAKDWLIKNCGIKAYQIIWEPLLVGKFGKYAETVSAVWFWNKLKLRGGSRGKNGREELAYLRGSFSSLAERVAEIIRDNGGQVITGERALSVESLDGCWLVKTDKRCYSADAALVTTALPVFSEMIADWAPSDYLENISKIEYLGNVCLVLELRQSLSDLYWINVNDPTFPFVGIIEHTNFVPSKHYSNSHFVYLSKYLPTDDSLYSYEASDFLEYTIPFIKKMFPAFDPASIVNYSLWRAPYSQPIVVQNYSELVPSIYGPQKGLYLCTMAQIYPEDRGTNYAVRHGRQIAKTIASELCAE